MFMSVSLGAQVSTDLSFFKDHISPTNKKKIQHKSIVDKNAIQSSGLFLLRVYSNLISSQDNHTCVFYPTCSSYCSGAMRTHGLIKGSAMSFDRLSRCHFLSPERYQIDIPKRKLIDHVD